MGEVSVQPAGRAASCVTVIVGPGAGEAACSCAHRFLNRNHLGRALPGLPSRPFRSDFPTTSSYSQPADTTPTWSRDGPDRQARFLDRGWGGSVRAGRAPDPTRPVHLCPPAQPWAWLRSPPTALGRAFPASLPSFPGPLP